MRLHVEEERRALELRAGVYWKDMFLGNLARFAVGCTVHDTAEGGCIFDYGSCDIQRLLRHRRT